MPTVVTFRNASCEISMDGGLTYLDMSNYDSKLELSGGHRQLAESFVFGQDYALVSEGKRGHLDIKLTQMYTEEAGGPAELIRIAYENGANVAIRWTAKGKVTGNYLFTSDPGFLQEPPYPFGEAGSAKEVVLTTTFYVPRVTKTVVV